MSSQYTLNVFMELLDITTVDHPEREQVMQEVQELQRVAEKQNYNLEMLERHLKEERKRKREVKVRSVGQELLQSTQQQYKEMVTGSLFEVIVVGMVLTNSLFSGGKFERVNALVERMRGRGMEGVVGELNEGSQSELEYEFNNIQQFLMQTSAHNEHLEAILTENDISNPTISKNIQLLYLLQSYIQINIQVILLVDPHSPHQKILTFNSQTHQDQSITILIEMAHPLIEYNLLIPSTPATLALPSCSLAKQIIKLLDHNTHQFKSLYVLQSLDDNPAAKETAISNLRAKVFARRIFSRQSSYTQLDSGKKRSVSPMLKNRECMRCKKLFQVDLKNFHSQISHLCPECKNNYFSTNY